jgi:2-amino-4-hydroxy-6-hydroxymethyldihydropteridine diphosphokinase/dihydropteroate synthase
MEIEWQGCPQELFQHLKKIEVELGRTEAPRWSPRRIDLDLLTFGDQIYQSENLQIPHHELLNRAFVLDPLKDLSSTFKVPTCLDTVSVLARKHKSHAPLIMGIINLTPDSFSDGGENLNPSSFELKIKKMQELAISIIDLGAESTRPGAQLIPVEEEWRRLEPALRYLKDKEQGNFFRQKISIDTSKPDIAERALSMGAHIINDVSGVTDPKMLGLIKESQCDFVFMHSLSLPAHPEICLPKEQDPVSELKHWLDGKLKLFESAGLNLDRAIFDPGIGFGKTVAQSITLLRRWDEFSNLPIRTLVGHSRKSFMKAWNISDLKLRDASTLGVSLALKSKGVDILRVHDFETHKLALQSFQEILR